MTQVDIDNSWVLVIDQGGHASRARVLDKDGRTQGYGEISITARHGADGHIEYIPEDLLASLQEAIKQATHNIETQRLRAAAMATQRSNIICWDKNTGQALSPIISWQDRRANQWLALKQEQATVIHARTGLFLSAHYGASKLHWCLQNIAAVQQAQKQQTLAWGPMASWLTSQLCQRRGPLVCDAVNASRTLLWSLHQCDWSNELLRIFDLPAGALPKSVPNQYSFGTLPVNDKTIPLQLVTGDQAAALYAFGIPRMDTAYITAGTGAFILNPCGQQPVNAGRLLNSIILLDKFGPHYALEGTVNGAGSALEHYARHYSLPNYIEKMPEWLQQTVNPPLFLNGFSGLGTPFMQADFNSRFIGDGDAIHHLVAVIESIVFLLQYNLEYIKQLNPSLQHIVIGGGLARFDTFCQRLADLGLAVSRPAQTETTSQGLAFLLDQDPGIDHDLKYQAPLENSATFKPQDNPMLKQRYQEWRKIMTLQLKND